MGDPMSDQEQTAKPGPTRLRRFVQETLKTAVWLTVALVGVSLWQARSLLPHGRDAAAPELAGSLLAAEGGGQRFDLAALRGRPVLIYFLAPWCGVCRVSVGTIDRIAVRPWREDLAVVAVALDFESEKEVEAFVQDTSLRSGRVPVVLGGSDVGARWKIDSYPTWYLVGADGNVLTGAKGYTSWAGYRVRSWIAEIGI